MQKFERSKNFDEIKMACEEAKFILDTSRYDEGSDYLTILGKFGGTYFSVIYAPFPGRFIGRMPDGEMFSSDDEKYEDQAWFQDMLNFFYIPKDEQPSQHRKAKSA